MPLHLFQQPTPSRRLAVAPLSALVAVTLALVGCSTEEPPTNRAVVIVSGGGAVSPFTTPTEACEYGLAAGNSDTALREYLLEQGKQVYTAPAMLTWGEVVEPEPDSFGAFGDCPNPLPEQLTIMSAGDITASAEKLARFLNYLGTEYGVTDVDLVAHSNGGLYSRGAIRILKQTEAPLTIRSLTMLGTPNEGAVPTAYVAGEFAVEDCVGDPICLSYNEGWKEYAALVDKGLNAQDTQRYLNGTDQIEGWNQAQSGYLDGIPVTLLAGTKFTNDAGNPEYWPYDGLVPELSALATNIPDEVIPHRTCWSAPLTHSISVSDFAGLDWQTALTWNADALTRVNEAIDEADSALDRPTREGCPTP